MAGHSKWANIKHRKGSQDARRGKIFTKIIREITVAARISGEMASNPRLRAAMDKGLSHNMSRDTLERAIKRGTGELDEQNFEEVRYEGYGPGGVALIVECLTDNRNRTVGEVRHAFTKAGGNLGTEGSVAYLFAHVGILTYSAENNEERLLEAALEAGASDVTKNSDGHFEVITEFADYVHVKEKMEAQGLIPAQAEILMKPSVQVVLDQDNALQVVKLVDMLEELDDVQNVCSNAEIPDAILASL